MRDRATTAFWAAGGLLAATTLVGLVWTALADPLDHRSFVRLGTIGMTAVGLGWSARARTYGGSFVRAIAVAGGLLAAAVVALVIASYHGDAVPLFGHAAPAYAPVSDYRRSVVVTVSSLGAVVAAFVLAGSLGPAARGAVVARTQTARGSLTFVLAVLMFAVCVARIRDGAQVAGALAIVSDAWLLWALHRARAARTLVE